MGNKMTLLPVLIGTISLYYLTKRLLRSPAFYSFISSLGYRVYVSPIGYYLNLKGEKEQHHSKTKEIIQGDVKIVPVAMRDDNYGYLIIDRRSGLAAAVDPADPTLVIRAIENENVKLHSILTTHKHWDHSGGNGRLLQKFPSLKIYGSAIDKVPSSNQQVYDNDKIQVGNLTFRAIESRVHTKGHILYLLEPQNPNFPSSLFSGDAIFIGGAGKFFESTGTEMYKLIEEMKRLDSKTLLFPGHEYTLSNLRFAQHLEPDNVELKEKLSWASIQRNSDLSTIPSTIEEEFSFNPFFRSNQQTIRDKLAPSNQKLQTTHEIDAYYLGALRTYKDNYNPS